MDKINIKKFFIEKSKVFYSKIQQIGFWILILMMIGGYVGIEISKHYINKQIDKAIVLGGFVHSGKVYNVTIDVLKTGK